VLVFLARTRPAAQDGGGTASGKSEAVIKHAA